MRDDLPTGTVTFLFTDIEGSTHLMTELGAEAYAEALAEHRGIVRDACASHDGVEVDTQGDAFFFAFAGARDAVLAASDAQQALANGRTRVRIGIHTGEPLLTEGGYVGVDVHRGARIMSAGHGGQVLMSAVTAGIVDLQVRDLGVHRLKDLVAGERLFQLGWEDYPPLRTLDATALPVAMSALIGREHEVSALVSLLRDDCRLVTLTGPGGTGKTRLALQVAAELVDSYTDGVWWVPLAGVADPELVLPAIRQALGARDELAHHLRERELLLVLDTFEHLVDAASDLGNLLANASGVRLIATSRIPLHLTAEYEYPVDPLPILDAATLFVERARAVGHDLELDEEVSEICARLDNLPLALELAAARTKLLDPRSLLARLEHRLPLLAGGPRDAPERQRTLRAAIEWSYDLLDDEAKLVFGRLAVFAGSFSIDAAEEVAEASLDVLLGLVDASLVRSVGEGRLLMLETIREYGLERLEETGEGAQTRDRHAEYFARLADGRWVELVRGDSPDWSISTIQLEFRNLHGAIEWSLERGRTEDVLAIGSGIYPWWSSFGYAHQGRLWLEQALERPSHSPSRRGHALSGFGELAWFEGDLDAPKRAYEEALALFRDLDEPFGIAVNLTQLADLTLVQGDSASARRFAEESAAIRRERLGSLHLGRALQSLANIAIAEEDYDQARALLGEAIELWTAQLPTSTHLILCHESLGEVLRVQGDTGGAVEAFATSLRFCQRRGEPAMPDALEGLAAVWSSLGKHERAARIAGAAQRIREQLGVPLPEHPDRPLPEPVEPAWSEGYAMSVEEALEYGLSSVTDG